VPGAELNGEVVHQVDHGGFGGRVSGDGVGACRPDADTGDGGGGNDAGGGVTGCACGEEGGDSWGVRC